MRFIILLVLSPGIINSDACTEQQCNTVMKNIGVKCSHMSISLTDCSFFFLWIMLQKIVIHWCNEIKLISLIKSYTERRWPLAARIIVYAWSYSLDRPEQTQKNLNRVWTKWKWTGRGTFNYCLNFYPRDAGTSHGLWSYLTVSVFHK